MLDKQIKIYSVDTGDFYSSKESALHNKIHKISLERNLLKNGGNFGKRKITGIKDIENQLNDKGISVSDRKALLKNDFSYDGLDNETINLCNKYIEMNEISLMKANTIKALKKKIKELLENKVNANIFSNGKHHIRELNPKAMNDNNIISVFDSSFTRLIKAEPDTLSEDFMVIQVYYFDVIKDLIHYGFKYKGEKYIYFTSSAGQIRTKKCVFIKESIWKEHERTIMCGLTIDSINAKGGSNQNKYLSYLALNNSSTDEWTDFDIDKAIVIDDFETDVFGTYDLIDDVEYSIKRVSDYVPIPHTDGAGMILPNAFGKEQKNMMVRLPWVKGLISPFDFRKFIEVNNCSSVIKDIYGVEHDVIEENIQVIFTKSQFKMHKYYDSFEQYKDYYKEFHCTAGYTNIERDRIQNATINYQMLQSLTDITDDEINEIIKDSVDRLNNLKTVDGVKQVLGITPYNQNKTALQKSIDLYPELLNDVYIRVKLKDIKDSMIKQFKSGKLRIRGKYTFLLPDYYAACEYWFMGIKNPEGLLKDGEVFCWLFRKDKELDCLRSPHLYREHAIRNNMAYSGYKEQQEEIREWFITDGIYTSCHDLISKILQHDVDGDTSLVVADKTFISVAKRNMKNIVPLYYNMRKANASILNSESIYDGLSNAFTSGHIGIYSNNISKIWNSEVFISGTDIEKQEALDLIKILCMESNFNIDMAKTLYMPERPEEINAKLVQYTKKNLPHFFLYAKDKTNEQIDSVNDSFVNKLENLIPNVRISRKSLELNSPNYVLLMNNPFIKVDEDSDFINKFKEINLNHKYFTSSNRNKELRDKLKSQNIDSGNFENIFYKEEIANVKAELSGYGYSDVQIADILVKYLYDIKNSKYKSLLWICYGEILYDNLCKNLDKKFQKRSKEKQCFECGEWFEVNKYTSNVCRCEKCNEAYKKRINRERVQRFRQRKKGA